MALNQACVGKTYPSSVFDASLESMQAYARAYNDDNRAFFDANRAGGILAPPLYAVVATWPAVMGSMADPELNVDLVRLLHSEQDMEFFQPIRPGDKITSTAKIASIETRSNGETMVVELLARNQRDEAVTRILFTIFIRGRNRGAAEARATEPEHAAPILSIAQTIDKDQTFRYRDASGDPNPIHVDENFAKMAGLPGIIVHGLCTMAFTSKVIVDNLCGRDPARLKRLRVRFTRPVFPGQAITTKVWEEGARNGRKIYGYETLNADAQAVIKGGIAEVSA